MTDFLAIGLGAAALAFVLGKALEASARARRLAPELARPPATPPSLYPRIDPDACICTGACIDACPEKDVLALVAGRPRLVRPSACVGHADCLRSCPVSAIELVLGSRDRAVEVPVVSSAFETTVPGLHAAGEITGVGLIHNALAQGRQAARAALDAAGRHDCVHDLVVIGAGPAGLGAALEARVRGARCTVFEKGGFGGAIQSYPRQKVVMSAPFDLPGLGKVALRRTSKAALLELFDDDIHRAGLAVVERAEVTAIRRVHHHRPPRRARDRPPRHAAPARGPGRRAAPRGVRAPRRRRARRPARRRDRRRRQRGRDRPRARRAVRRRHPGPSRR